MPVVLTLYSWLSAGRRSIPVSVTPVARPVIARSEVMVPGDAESKVTIRVEPTSPITSSAAAGELANAATDANATNK